MSVHQFSPEYMRIPVRTLDALMAYVWDKVPTGGFLRAVLEDSFAGALGAADEENRTVLYEIHLFVWNRIPAACWGSPEKVAKWLSREPVVSDE